MINIILISKTNIINKIFTLVTKKLSINIDIISDDSLLKKVDLIVADDEFKNNDIIKYKSYCDKLILISTNEIIDNNFDAIFKKPFLPSQLEQLLQHIIMNKNKKPTINIDENVIIDDQEKDVDDLISFVDNISDDKIKDPSDEYNNLYEDEDTVVTKDELGHGGVLDKDELSKLFNLINDEEEENISNVNMEENDWVDLSEIIDKAIEDVNGYEFDTSKPIKLILNNYSMKELSPLFNKLNQGIIDDLVEGKEIILQLKLEN